MSLATVHRLPCAEFTRWLHAVLGERAPGTTVPLRVLHPSAFEVVAEAACSAEIRCASRAAFIELAAVMNSYRRELPLLVRGIARGSEFSIAVEVA